MIITDWGQLLTKPDTVTPWTIPRPPPQCNFAVSVKGWDLLPYPWGRTGPVTFTGGRHCLSYKARQQVTLPTADFCRDPAHAPCGRVQTHRGWGRWDQGGGSTGVSAENVLGQPGPGWPSHWPQVQCTPAKPKAEPREAHFKSSLYRLVN